MKILVFKRGGARRPLGQRRGRGRPRSGAGFDWLLADARLYAASTAARSDRAIAERIAGDLCPGMRGAVDRVRMFLTRHDSERLDYRMAALFERALMGYRVLVEQMERALTASPVDVDGALLANARAEHLHGLFVAVEPFMRGILQRTLTRIERVLCSLGGDSDTSATNTASMGVGSRPELEQSLCCDLPSAVREVLERAIAGACIATDLERMPGSGEGAQHLRRTASQSVPPLSRTATSHSASRSA